MPDGRLIRQQVPSCPKHALVALTCFEVVINTIQGVCNGEVEVTIEVTIEVTSTSSATEIGADAATSISIEIVPSTTLTTSQFTYAPSILPAINARIPPCALTCWYDAVAKNQCNPSDWPCQCSKPQLVWYSAKPCLEEACGSPEAGGTPLNGTLSSPAANQRRY